MTTTVAFVHHALRRGGGSERVEYDIIRHLDPERFTPLLCCLYSAGEYGEELGRQGHEIHSDLQSRPWDLRGVFRLARILHARRVDVLYVTDGLLNMVVGRLAAALARTPVTVLGFHSYDTVLRRRVGPVRRAFLQVVDRLFHPTFDYYIALGDRHKSYLTTVKRLPPDRIAAIPNGLDPREWEEDPAPSEELRTALGLEPTDPVLAMIAGLRPWKSHDVLLRSLAGIAGSGVRAHLVLAGDGPERGRLHRMTTELGLDGLVHFLGNVEDVRGLISEVDMVVLSSEHEAFPLALLEAMAMSRPVVATAVGSVADIVDHGRTGFLVPWGDSGALAEAILGLLEDPVRARSFGVAGRKRVLQRFTTDEMMREYESRFSEWAAETRRRRRDESTGEVGSGLDGGT